MTDINAWFKKPDWNFAHRLDHTGWSTLCRRAIPARTMDQAELPVAEDHDARCPICTAILAKGAL